MDHQNNAGKTPLHGAAQAGQLDVVKLFISSGANFNILDNEGNTAFDLGKKHIEVASYLGHVMGEKYITDNKYEDALKVYKELLIIQEEKLGGDHSETSKTRDYLSSVETILFKTGRSDEKPQVPYDWAKDLNAKNHEGKTPLHISADKGDLESVKAFVSMGAKLTIRDNDGKTAFDLGKKHIEVASYIGHIMGEQYQKEDKYEDALEIYKELLNIQEEKLGSDHSKTSKTRDYLSSVETILFETGRSDEKPQVPYDWAKDINAKNHEGKTPLHISADKGDLENVKSFVSMGAKLAIRDNDGKTAFDLGKKHVEVASYIGHIMGELYQKEDKYEDALEIYKELLNIQEEKLGSDHSETSKTRDYLSAVQTILFKTGRSDEEPLVPYDWAKDVDVQNHEGKTPLHMAADIGSLDGAKWCMSLGANISIRDNDGKTAFDLAKKHIEVATYLGHAMGVRFQNEEKYENAMQIYTELLEVQEEVLGCDHTDTSKTRELLSAVENMLNLHLMKLDGHGL